MSTPGTAAIVTFRRLSPGRQPERELVSVDDAGTATAWRSNGHAIGRFAGPVPDLDALEAAIGAVGSGEPPPPLEVPPDAAIETVEVERRMARFEARAPVEGPWTELVQRCRALLDSTTASPVAAVVGELSGDGRLRLEQHGSEALPLELASLRLEQTLWRDGQQAARGVATEFGLDRVDAGPGWAVLLDPPAMDLSGGGMLVAVASFVAEDDGIYVPVSLSARADVPA